MNHRHTGLFVLVATLLLIAGCDRSTQRTTSPEQRAQLGLPAEPIDYRGARAAQPEWLAELPDQWQWTALAAAPDTEEPERPAGRWGPAIGYDAARGEVVIFGGTHAFGEAEPGYPRSTWAWDGQHWRHADSGEEGPAPSRTDDGFPQKALGVMAFDDARQHLVMLASTGTWRWEGDGWEQLADEDESPTIPTLGYTTRRRDVLEAAPVLMYFDDTTDRIVLIDSPSTDEPEAPWTRIHWDGHRWSDPEEINSPGDCQEAVAAFDQKRREVMLWGCDWPEYEEDARAPTTRIFDGQKWREGPEEGPPHRVFPTLYYDESHERVVLFGAEPFDEPIRTMMESDKFTQMWTWDGEEWEQLSIGGHVPVTREQPGMAYDAERGRLVMTGGVALWKPGAHPTTATLDETWEFDGRRWEFVSGWGESFPGRIGHGIAYDPLREQVVMVGGSYLHGMRPLSDTLIFDGERWEVVADGDDTPVKGTARTMGFDSQLERVVLLNHQGETWSFDDQEWEKVDAGDGPVPSFGELPAEHASYDDMPAASGFAPVYDAGRNKLVVVDDLGATWVWDDQQWKEIVTADDGPGPRVGHAAAYHPHLDRIVLFGGLRTAPDNDNGERLDDTWILDGDQWTRVEIEDNPSTRVGHTMVYDTRVERILLIGGEDNGGNASVLWAFDGRTWEQPAQQGTDDPSQLNQRSWHATTFDETRDQVMLFGGMAGPMRWLRVFSDTLALKW